MLDDLYGDAYCQAREDLLLKAQLLERAIPQEPPYGGMEALTAKRLLD